MVNCGAPRQIFSSSHPWFDVKKMCILPKIRNQKLCQVMIHNMQEKYKYYLWMISWFIIEWFNWISTKILCFMFFYRILKWMFWCISHVLRLELDSLLRKPIDSDVYMFKIDLRKGIVYDLNHFWISKYTSI